MLSKILRMCSAYTNLKHTGHQKAVGRVVLVVPLVTRTAAGSSTTSSSTDTLTIIWIMYFIKYSQAIYKVNSTFRQ